MRICVVTSYAAAAEPRAPRHAVAARHAFPDADVIFVDLVAAGTARRLDPVSLHEARIARHTVEFPTRASNPAGLVVRKLRRKLGHLAFNAAGRISESLLSDHTQGLTRVLCDIGADLYIAHNIETLLPAATAAERVSAALMFDCMEYYSDMGDGQSPVMMKAARQLETRLLPACQLVLASSDRLADTLAEEYGIRRPFPSYNVPPMATVLPSKRGGGLNLYWRNSVIGFGQRGLEDVLEAMTQVPADVCLFLQGRLQVGGAGVITRRADELGLAGRVTILAPYKPEEAVQRAAPYDVGLCLERRGPRNHDLTVSNKMFDYHMGGLAVIASNLPSLSQVIARSKGGIVYEPGNVASLAVAICRLHDSPGELAALQANARRFALEEANLELELTRLAQAMRSAMVRSTEEAA